MRKSRKRASRKRASRKQEKLNSGSRKRINIYKMNRVHPLQICALANLTDQTIQQLYNDYPELYEIYEPQRLQAIRDLYVKKLIQSSREYINNLDYNYINLDANYINNLIYNLSL